MRLDRIFLAAFVTFTTSISAHAETLVSDKYIALMRHGVRPQTSSKELAQMSAKQWPVWDAQDGQLTPHGAKAAAQLAEWEIGMLAAKGLVPSSGCPAPDTIFGWANSTVQRTIDTGNVVLSAMFEGCALKVGSFKGDGPDPLYEASSTALGAIDVEKAKASILQAAGGSFDRMKERPHR